MLRTTIWASKRDTVKVTTQKGSIVTVEIMPEIGDNEVSTISFTGRPDQLASLLRALIEALETSEPAQLINSLNRPVAGQIMAELREEAQSA